MIRTILLTQVVLLLSVSCASNYTLNNHTFPSSFKFGVATAAYQIEGGWNEDGKGVSLWDWYVHNYPEKITNADNGDVACNSYHKWQEDIQLLKDLGVNHYRLSISWSRVLPDGTVNNINQKGVDYYVNILKALKEANIEALVTLYHWDLPLPFHQLGGWTNPLIADYFAEYARFCFVTFGSYVKTWLTLNEPHSTCVFGYGTGFYAPGYQMLGEGVYLCAYTHVLAHAKAYRVYDEEFRDRQEGRVSIVIDSPWAEAYTNSTEDLNAVKKENAFFSSLYAHPIYKGNWPQLVIDTVSQRSSLEGYQHSRLPAFTEEEIAYINGTSDFFCLNTYSTNLVQHQNDVDDNIGNASYYLDKGTKTFSDPSWPGDVDWVHLVPWGFRKLLNYIYQEYNHPEILVTENGWADLTGQTNDTDRITYISQYLSALLNAVYEDGVNVTGYTAWSLLDNLEWTHGYTQKLGLVQVDFNNSNRTPKESFIWYQGVVKSRCLVDQCS